jgi:hypothetical protein
MKVFRHKDALSCHVGSHRRRMVMLVAVSLVFASHLFGQTQSPEDLSQQIQKLTEAMARTQSQLEESQRELDEMRHQLASLQKQLGAGNAIATSTNLSAPVIASSSSSPAPQVAPAINAATVQDIRDRQAMDESQIATHEQVKVESESKYPIKITGLLLFNGFANTSSVDVAATPTLALPGGGSTGASVRQTVLGFDASGPHLFGARSHADLRVDFDGTSQSNSTTIYAGPYASQSLLRLRTAHATLNWDSTEAFFSLDRPIISPEVPTSLTAVAEPALAWSGDLWTWNPQLGVTRDIHYSQSHVLRFQAALIDPGDAPQTAVPTSVVPNGVAPGASEQSRWPGTEARIALYDSPSDETASHIGVGGYYSRHSSLGYNFDAWAATLDARLRLPLRFQFSGSFYRGAALGGLGGGGYKDYVFREDPITGGHQYHALDDIGGWAQLKEKFNAHWEANAAFGMDNVFASELYHYSVTGGSAYQNLARNSTYTGNVIFSPSAYLLFSVEYRHIISAPIFGLPANSNIIGLGAGYKF